MYHISFHIFHLSLISLASIQERPKGIVKKNRRSDAPDRRIPMTNEKCEMIFGKSGFCSRYLSVVIVNCIFCLLRTMEKAELVPGFFNSGLL
jgi:hypothetical protein